MKLSKISRYVFIMIVLAVVYHLAARLGLQMAYVQANTSPVWPPSGIGLAALLILGIRYWPGITLGVVVGSLLTGAPLPIALGLGAANTLEAWIGSYLLRNILQIHLSLDRIRDVVGLVFAAAVSTSVSASIGVASLYVAQQASEAPFFTLWVTWWIGNLLGMLVVAPFLMVWAGEAKQFLGKLDRKVWLEGAVFLVLLFLVTGYVFENTGGDNILHQALIYMIFPFAIWASLRLGQPGAVTTIFAISGIAIWDTVHGMGPFSQLPMNDSLILLQTFTGVVSLTTLTLAASAAERRHAEGALNRRVEDLAVLNDASKEFLGNLEKTALFEAICRLAVERMGLSTAWIELTQVEKTAPGSPSSVIAMHPASQAPGELTQKIYAQPAVRKIIRQGEESGQSQVLEGGIDPGNPTQGTNAPLSCAAFPLRYAGNVVGVLCAVTTGPGGFPKEEVLLLESYANLAAMAIQNAWLFNQVRLGNEQLHALSHRLMEVQEDERLHLSRELHDESGQILAALMVRLGLLERDVEIPEQRNAHIAELRRIVKEILNNLHNLAVKLRPASLDHLGLITALKQYAEEYSRQYPVEVQFEAMEIETTRLPAEVETALFRILQESLTNIALHAQASRVDILLNRRNGCLVMTIEDNGVGFDPNLSANETRLGLFGMRERVDMLGGRLMIESSPGKGTTISVEVPYDHPGARR